MRLLGIAALCVALLTTSGADAAATDDPRLVEWAVKVIQPHLAKFKKYPPGSTTRHEEGDVYVGFTINRKGELLGSKMIRDSKFKDLNDAALAMVRDAKPFPPFPAGIKQDQISLSLPVRFSWTGMPAGPRPEDIKVVESSAPLLSSPPSLVSIESTDCEALKNTNLPYQIKWTADGKEITRQIFRQAPKGLVAWRSTKPRDGTIEIDHLTSFDGGMEGSATNNWVNGPNKRTIKYTFSGLSETFDGRSNVTYTQTLSITDDKGATTQSTLPIEYEFVRETKKVFGFCILDLVIGRQRYVRDGRPESWSFTYFLPQLQGSHMQRITSDFELTTKFEQLKHFK